MTARTHSFELFFLFISTCTLVNEPLSLYNLILIIDIVTTRLTYTFWNYDHYSHDQLASWGNDCNQWIILVSRGEKRIYSIYCINSIISSYYIQINIFRFLWICLLLTGGIYKYISRECDKIKVSRMSLIIEFVSFISSFFKWDCIKCRKLRLVISNYCISFYGKSYVWNLEICICDFFWEINLIRKFVKMFYYRKLSFICSKNWLRLICFHNYRKL